ncbi:hypothetical protein EB796_011887 [Bugula neritina]|uniref:Uncharacterized protein n=1 Tax=Bugula neritina TaxID=10212 RepID=A0A7J7JTU1_BUGNE|nr:hypothetical protein EB796_011887 [Bugula neritina]
MENELTNASNDDQASVTQKLVNGSSYQHQAYTSISPAVVTTALTTKSAVSSSPFRSLPNIQPKNSESAIPPRQLIPKADGTSAQGAGAVQPNNVLIPQGIQHVLINGQLYPIIQTANGTHLLIQQPVGQVQHSTAKQVFTAQPVQLGGMAPSQSTQVLTAGNHMQISNSQSLPATEQTNDSVSNADSNIHTTAGNLGLAPIMPISSTGINTMTSTSSSHFLPTSQTPTNSFHMQPVASSQSNTLNNSRRSTNSGSVVVSPQAQQLLAKIQHQLQLFKRKPVLDEEAKKAYAQLQQAEHQVLNNIQSQLQAHRAGQDAGQMGQPANQGAAVGFGAVGPPGQPPPPQASLSAQHSLLLQHGVTPSSANKSELIIKPVPEGASPLTQENIMAIMNAFANVKVGTQIYNIQLTDGQKKSFIEAMSTMTAQSQHSFLLQQQTEILLTVFKNQQQQQELIQQQFQQQNQLAVQSQQNFIPQFQQPQTPASSQLPANLTLEADPRNDRLLRVKVQVTLLGSCPKFQCCRQCH